MTDLARLYRIEVVPVASVRHDLVHRTIKARTPIDAAVARYALADVLAARRWAAGVLARVALAVTEEFHEAEWHARFSPTHDCPDPADRLVTCGYFGESAIAVPWDDGWSDGDFHTGCSPMIWFSVPTVELDKWLTTVRDVVAKVLLDDQQPADPPVHEIVLVVHNRTVVPTTTTTRTDQGATP